MVFAASLPAANYYWDPSKSNTDPGSGGTGIWDTTSTFWKLAGTSGDVVWPNTTANTADFAGTAGTVTLGSAITAGGLIFDTAGYSLTTVNGGTTYTLTLGSSGIAVNSTSSTATQLSGTVSAAALPISIAAGGAFSYTSGTFSSSGKTVFSGTSGTVTGGTASFAGTENFDTGASNYGGVQGATLINTAGTMTFTPNTGNAFYIGGSNVSGVNSTLNVTGGTVQVSSNTRIFIGDGYNGTASLLGNGTLSIGGSTGAASFSTGTTTNNTAWTLGSNSGATGAINLLGNGTLATARVFAAGGTGNGSINFNGGTLQATGTTLAIPNTVTTAIQDNGGTIDSNGFAISLAANITHGGTAATDGGLTIKAGSGSTTLSGTLSFTGGLTTNTLTTLTANNSYTGPTLVSAGELYANGTGILPLSTSAVTVASGANVTVGNHAGGTFQTMTNNFTLNGTGTSVSALSSSGTLAAGALAFLNSGGFSLTGNFNLASNSLIYDNPATQTGNITFSGVISGVGGLTLAGAGSSGTAVNIALTNANTYGTTNATTQFTNFTSSPQMTVNLTTVNNVLPTNTALTLGGVPTGQGGTYNGNVSVALGGINQTVAGLTTGGTSGTYSIVGNSATLSTFTVNNTASSTFTGILGGTGTNNNNLALTKTGTGTLTLTGANTYTGATTINNGTLNLGGSTANGSITGSALALGGGTLNYSRTGTNTQTFTGTTINSGGSSITNAVSTDTLALGAITRNSGGTVNFTGPGAITTTSANTATSILGGWATYGLNDWAASAGNGTTAGNITALSTYFVSDDVANLANNTANGTSNVTDNNGYNATYTNSLTINSLRFNAGGSDSNFGIVNGNNLTLNSGGILVTNNVGAKYQRIGFLNTSFVAGQGQGGITTAANGDLVINQNNSGTGHLEIYSTIYGSGVNLVKSGVGYFELRGLNASYTGNTVANGGTMKLTAATTGTTGVVVNNSGTLLLGANDRISNTNNATNVQNVPVTLNGGTLNTGGFKEGNATGSATATQGLGALTLSSNSTLDFGLNHAGSSVLAFAASNTQTWSGILTLADFTPGTDFLNFASSTGLTATQLGEISLSGFTATGLDSFGDVLFAPVPEPATWAAGVLMVGVAGWQFRRRTARRAA